MIQAHFVRAFLTDKLTPPIECAYIRDGSDVTKLFYYPLKQIFIVYKNGRNEIETKLLTEAVDKFNSLTSTELSITL